MTGALYLYALLPLGISISRNEPACNEQPAWLTESSQRIRLPGERKTELITRRELITNAIAAAGITWITPDASGNPAFPGMDRISLDVRRFGAKGDGKTPDTRAVQNAIDSSHRDGGGFVTFATGCTFLIGTIYLKDNVRLYLQPNSVILGSDDLIDYGKDVGISPFYPEPLDLCLIYAKDAVNIGISGEGTIIGHAREAFTPAPGTLGRPAEQRPMLIRFENCKEIFISDVSLQRCGSWCVHLKRSRDIFLRSLRIHNEMQDGFDLESCQNVSISDCQLECGDDAIAVTTSSLDYPARNITVTNCLLRSRWAGIRFGPLSKGNFENIAVSNCIFYDCNGGGIKLGMYEGAAIRDCVFDNLVMDHVSAPVSIFIATWPEIGSVEPNPPMMPVGRVSGLQFRGIQVVTKPGAPDPRPDLGDTIFLQGHPKSSIENILFEDISVTFAGGGTIEQASRRDIVDMDQIDVQKDGYWTDDKSTWGVPPAYGLYARHVNGLILENVRFRLANPDRRSPMFFSDSNDIRVSGFEAACDPVDVSVITVRESVDLMLSEVEAQPRAATLVRIEGPESARIVLVGNDPRNYSELFRCAAGAKEKAVLQLDSRERCELN